MTATRVAVARAVRTPPHQRQHPVVLEQHDALPGRLESDRRRARPRRPGPRPQASMPTAYIERRMRRTMSESRSRENLPRAKAACSGAPNASAPNCDRVELRAGFLIEPGAGVLPAAGGPPVRHHPARVAPRPLQHLLQELGVGACVVTVDPVVGGHHGARVGAFDGQLEGEQVGLAVRRRVDDRIEPMAVGLVAVEREVLDRRDHPLALNALDRRRGQDRAEQRVLGQVLEVASVAGVAGKVDASGQQHVETAAAGLAADHRPRGRGPAPG